MNSETRQALVTQGHLGADHTLQKGLCQCRLQAPAPDLSISGTYTPYHSRLLFIKKKNLKDRQEGTACTSRQKPCGLRQELPLSARWWHV